MESNCSLPLSPNWVARSVPTSRLPILPTWDELEPLASFTSEAMSHEYTHQSSTFKDRLRRELQLRKLVRLPSKVLKQILGHNAILDLGVTSSVVKSNGGAKSTGQPSNKEVRIPNSQTLSTSFKALVSNTALNPKARECDILPGLQHNSLVSVGKVSYAAYCPIFMPGNQGVQVIGGNNVKIQVS